MSCQLDFDAPVDYKPSSVLPQEAWQWLSPLAKGDGEAIRRLDLGSDDEAKMRSVVVFYFDTVTVGPESSARFKEELAARQAEYKATLVANGLCAP